RNHAEFGIGNGVGVCFGQKVAASLKRVSHVFFSLIPACNAFGEEQETPPPAMRKASFMVNKTSTIKRIVRPGRLPEQPVPEAATLKERVAKV
ncbi:MAG: hypothetical protein ACYCZL_02875, partial [Polaromonas sp.]